MLFSSTSFNFIAREEVKKELEILFLHDTNSVAILLPTSMNLNKFQILCKVFVSHEISKCFLYDSLVIQLRCKLHMHIVILRWWYSGAYLMIFIAKHFFYYHGYYLSIDFHIWNIILLC